MDAMWNDDFHHTAMVALIGRNEAYYTDYRGSAQEFVSVAKYGFLYQGQWYRWQKQPRGTPALRLHPEHLVLFIQNHDQIANSGLGQRVNELAGAPQCRAMTAFMLLARARRCCSWGRNLRLLRRFSTSPITTLSWPTSFTRVAGSFWRSFAVSLSGGPGRSAAAR